MRGRNGSQRKKDNLPIPTSRSVPIPTSAVAIIELLIGFSADPIISGGDESPSERPTKSNLLSVGHGHPRVLPRRSMISRVVAVSPSLLTSTRLHTDQL